MKKSILLFGGGSDERLVSVASAQNLASQFAFEELWFVLPDGHISKIEKTELLQHKNPFKAPLEPSNKPFVDSIQNALPLLAGKTVFMGFHGTQGEDGFIQSLFEPKKIAFTGSGSESSRRCFDKTAAKQILQKYDIPVATQLVVNVEMDRDFEATLTDFLSLNLKIVIKPVANGSSIGLHIVNSVDSLKSAVTDMKKSLHPLYMAEKFIKGRELTIGVTERNGQLIALPPSEVLVVEGSSFDYDGKYLGTNTKEITPADLKPDEVVKAQDLALLAHRKLQCFGYSRTDAILSPEGLFFIETNTLPGVTKASFIPQQLAVANISMTDFIQEQLNLADSRYR